MEAFFKKHVKHRPKRTLKRKITNYISSTDEQDICCEDDYNRHLIVAEIIRIYKSIYGDCNDEYLEWLDNDLIGFVGYKSRLEDKKDTVGLKLWEEIFKTNRDDSGNLNKDITTTLLIDLPLYYLLAFLGSAHLKLKRYNFDMDKMMYDRTKTHLPVV